MSQNLATINAEKSVPSSNLVGALIILLISFSALNNIDSSVQLVGTLTILVLSFFVYSCILYYLAKRKPVPSSLSPIIFLGISFLAISAVGILLKNDLRFFITLYQFLLVFMVFIVCSMMYWTSKRLRMLYGVTTLILLLNTPYIFLGGKIGEASGIFNNPNVLGAILCFSSCFILLYRLESRKKNMATAVFLLMMIALYYTGSRAAFISLAAVLLVYMTWKFIIKGKKRFILFFTFVMTGVLSFTFIYPRLIYWSNFNQLNYLMWKYTGKNLMSGRDMIWLQLFEIIEEKILFGYGSGALPRDFLEGSLSSHNLYLQIALQVGLIGLLILLTLLIFIWSSLWHGRNDNRVRLAGAYFCGIMVHQAFEVTLTQNNISVGLLQWLIIAIGVSYSIKLSKASKENILIKEHS